MRTYKPAKPIIVCCIYCRKEFAVRGKQRGHNCPQATKVRRAIARGRVTNWRKRQFTKKPEGFSKAVWTVCTKCKDVLTPNYFGVCDNCRSILSSQMDMDMIIGFDEGYEKRNGSRIW